MVARSSPKAKFRAIAHGIYEGLWIKRMLEKLKIGVHQPMQFFSDNKVALEISHFIKEKIESRVLDISYMPTKEQVEVYLKAASRIWLASWAC